MKLKDIFEATDPVLTAKEKKDGWIVKNGTKIKIGKARPFKQSDRADDHEGERVGSGRRKSRASSDDGSRGLSSAERNR